MSVWSIIRNAGTILSFVRAFIGLFENIAETKQVPPAEQIADLVEKAAALLASGAVDLKNVDEKALADSLMQIHSQLVQK